MKVKINALNDMPGVPVLNSDMTFDITCVGITTGVGRDGRLVLEYRTGLSFEVETGYSLLVYPLYDSFMHSLALTNSIQIITDKDQSELVLRFKTNTDSIPSIYEVGDVCAKAILIRNLETELEYTPFVAAVEESNEK